MENTPKSEEEKKRCQEMREDGACRTWCSAFATCDMVQIVLAKVKYGFTVEEKEVEAKTAPE